MTTYSPIPFVTNSYILQQPNDSVAVSVASLGSINFSLQGTPVGATVIFEYTSDGINWVAKKAYSAANTAGSTTVTTEGVYNVSAGGAEQIRARLVSITSGSFTAFATGTASVDHVNVKNDVASDLNTTSLISYQNSQGAQVIVTAANPLPVTGGGGGSGSSLSDVLLTDTTGTLFVARDTGSAITYANVTTGATYTPSGTIQASGTGVDGTGITQPTGGSGIRGWLSGIYKAITGTLTIGGTVSVSGTVPVSGTFYQATQPVSGTVSVSGTVPVSGTFYPATQPISATALPLPTGAATSANQPALNGDGGSLAHVTNFPTTQAVTTPLAAPVTGQVSIATTGTALALGSGALVNGIVIKANTANAATILVGGSGVTNVSTGTGNGYPLAPGEAISIASSNLSQVYINGTAADFVSYAGN